MFALGIPNRQYRRTTQVLGHESSEPIPYQAEKQDDGFYLFTFPNCDEYDFRDIVRLLKVSGITTIGADTQLTEKRIMKLVDLINLPVKEDFHGDDFELSAGYTKARDLIVKLRQQYRKMSDEDLDEFSKEMIAHFLDNVEAKDYARRKLSM